MAARGLTRKITRKQAKSYRMTTPNPLGVTAIASVNRGLRTAEYNRRYKRTKSLLSKKTGAKKMAHAARRTARRNYTAREMEELFEKQRESARPRKTTKKRTVSKAKAAAHRRAALKKVGGRFKRLTGRIGTKSVNTYAYKGKGGKPKKIPLWAILGASSQKDLQRRVADSPRLARRVVAAKTRREKKAEHLRLHGDLFTPNRRASRRRVVPYKPWSEENMLTTPNRRRKARANRKLNGAALAKWKRQHPKLVARWGRSSKKRASTTKRHASGRRKARTAAQRRATSKMLSARWGKRIHKRKAWKNHSVAAIPNRPKRRRAHRNVVVLQPNRKRRKARRNPVVMQAAANRRRHRARKNAGMTISQAAANRRKRSRKSRKNAGMTISQAAANRRRHGRKHARSNQGIYNNNRRRHHRRHARSNQVIYNSNRRRHRRHYRRNPDLMAQLTSVLKVGAKVAVGFIIHRGATYLIAEKGLATMEVFSTGSLAEYRGIIGGLVALVAGVPLVTMAFPKKGAESTGAEIAAGMAVSFLHKTLVTLLAKAGQPEIAGYLSAYPDAEGSAMHSMKGYRGYGSYEVVPGLSSYETVPGLSGMGAYDYYRQYQGMGAVGRACPPGQIMANQCPPGFMLSASGKNYGLCERTGAGGVIAVGPPSHTCAPSPFHGFVDSPLQQAAAGYGASPLQQAAAGVGEFFLPGAKAIGEYEASADWGPMSGIGAVDEGIHPNLDAAEHALSVAEAAAGVGDLPMFSQVDAFQVAAPVLDAPGGSRAGILQGDEGIFGKGG